MFSHHLYEVLFKKIAYGLIGKPFDLLNTIHCVSIVMKDYWWCIKTTDAVHSSDIHMLIKGTVINDYEVVVGYIGFTSSVRASVRLSVRPASPVQSVASTVQDGFFPYLVQMITSMRNVSHLMTFDLDLYLQGHSTLTLKIVSAL